MIPVLTFIFASWGHFIGTCVLLVLVAVIVAMFAVLCSKCRNQKRGLIPRDFAPDGRS